jgi:LPS-assembly lipoprotein
MMMRRLLIIPALLAATALGACGFQPLYARGGGDGVPDELTRVRIGSISDPAADQLRNFRRDYPIENDRSRQILRNFLSDDLSPRGGGGATQREYVLDVQLIEPRTNIAIDRSDTTLRYGYSVVAYFQLKTNAGRSLFAGTSSSATTFAVSQSEYATIASQRDARERAMQEISVDIRNQLAAYFFTQTHKTPS